MNEKTRQRRIKQFTQDMTKTGLEVYQYRGRYFYEGPAVNVNHVQRVTEYTKVKCQWDQMGKGYVVYPILNSDS